MIHGTLARLTGASLAILAAALVGRHAGSLPVAAKGASHGEFLQSAPSALTSDVSGSSVTLAWQTAAGASVHLVEAGSRPGLSNLAQVVVPAAPAVFHGVPSGSYFVRVRSGLPSGWSEPSNEIVVRVGCAAPLPPTDLASLVNGPWVSLGWETQDDAQGYVVEAGSGPGLANLASLPVAAVPFVVQAPPGRYHVRVRAVNACGVGAPSEDTVVSVGLPSGAPIYGEVDPSVLGTCPASAHDAHVTDGGDGYRYRTWHPQTDPTGCVYAHEHGDDPAISTNIDIRSAPVRFGYIGRRRAQAEEHEGFKVFIANRGETNGEGEVSLIDSRIVVHMGTGAPRRFALSHQSVEQRVIAPGGIRLAVQVMADSTGIESACTTPRAAGKIVTILDPTCVVSALYEIWNNAITIRYQGRDLYRGLAPAAVLDPITAFDPANPSRLLYVWDPALAIINRHGADWSSSRGCNREAYHLVGYVVNGEPYDTGRTIFYTDAMGEELPSTSPQALRQEISRHLALGPPATQNGQFAFNLHRGHCGQLPWLGLKN